MKTLILLLISISAFAQIPIGGAVGSGGSSSGTASAIRSGLLADIPATCAVADVYYATDAATSTGLWRLYVCTATNTWTQTGIQGNVDGSLTCISSATNQSDCQVTPGVFALISGNNTFTGDNSFATGTFSVAGATHTIPQQVVATDPTTCTVGESYVDTTTSPALAYDCLTTNTWTRRTPAAQPSFEATLTGGCQDTTAPATIVVTAVSHNGTDCVAAGSGSNFGGPYMVHTNATGYLQWATSVPVSSTSVVASVWLATKNSFGTGPIEGNFQVACVTSGSSGNATFGSAVTTNQVTNTNAVNGVLFKLTSTLSHSCAVGDTMLIRHYRTQPTSNANVYAIYYRMERTLN